MTKDSQLQPCGETSDSQLRQRTPDVRAEAEVSESGSGIPLREIFMASALANATLCTGTTPEWQLQAWFGGRTGIKREEIAARQAREYAEAMLIELSKA